MKTQLLMKKNVWEIEEATAAVKNFDMVTFRSAIKKRGLNQDTVVCRYPCSIEDYGELCTDIKNMGGSPLNSFEQHRWIAEFEYYELLKDYTPTTYFSGENLPDIPLVVKGSRDSEKFSWDTKMFAENAKEAKDIAYTLSNDGWIKYQDIIFREYVPLKRLGPDFLNGLPCTNEWRFFIYYDQIIDYNFYWDEIVDQEELDKKPTLWSGTPEDAANKTSSNHAINFVKMLASIIFQKKQIPFYVIDVGQKENGEWTLIELNDGGMSGLSGIDPEDFYKSLGRLLNGR